MRGKEKEKGTVRERDKKKQKKVRIWKSIYVNTLQVQLTSRVLIAFLFFEGETEIYCSISFIDTEKFVFLFVNLHL